MIAYKTSDSKVKEGDFFIAINGSVEGHSFHNLYSLNPESLTEIKFESTSIEDELTFKNRIYNLAEKIQSTKLFVSTEFATHTSRSGNLTYFTAIIRYSPKMEEII